MSKAARTEIEKLSIINDALVRQVERAMDQQGSSFTLFQTAVALESRVQQRTDELTSTLRRLETTNRDLLKAKEMADAANVSKTRFIAAASHDVLQPLNAARLSISALSELQTTPQAQNLVGQVERALDTMDELLRTLLDISKLDSGVMQPHLSQFSLDDLLADLQLDFAPLAQAKGLDLRLRRCNAMVTSDRTMLRRILQNLISNAIRYTIKGGIVIGARRRGSSLRIDIADTGIGIETNDYEAIFAEFHRGSIPATLTDSGGGLGLGLAIVQRMAASLNHRLEFRSEPGRGTVFQLFVPYSQAVSKSLDAPARAPAGPRNFRRMNRRVLLIENDHAVRDSMTALLANWGCEVRSSAAIDEALQQVSAPDWSPDIIVADQNLDHGDLGSDAISAVRKATARAVPALIVTAGAMEDTRNLGDCAQVEVLRKPLKPAELRALMTHLLA